MFTIPEIALYALDVYYNQTYLQTSSKKKLLDRKYLLTKVLTPLLTMNLVNNP